MLKEKVELARERLIKAVNQVLGVVRRNGRSRKVGLALALMVLLGGRSSVRNAAETFRLDYANLLEALGELHDAWRDYLEVLSGLVKGEVAVIIDDTVDHKEYSRGRDVSPHGNYWTAVIRFCLDFKAIPNEKSHNCCTGSTATPTGGSRGACSSSRSP